MEAMQKVLQEIDQLQGLGFEDFRESVIRVLREHVGTWEFIIGEFGKHNRKFHKDMLKAFKKENRKEFDAAFEGFRNLSDRIGVLELSTYSLFVMFRKNVLGQTLTDHDKHQIAALFGIDLKAIVKDHARELWNALEEQTGLEAKNRGCRNTP